MVARTCRDILQNRNRPSQWNYPQVGGRIDYRHCVRDFDIQISGTDATARDSNDLPWLKDAVITADTKLRGKCSCSEFEDTKTIGNCREAGCRPASYSSKPQSLPITCMHSSPRQRYALHDPCQLFGSERISVLTPRTDNTEILV